MSTLGGAYGDYGSYGGEPLSGISGVSYPSEAGEDGGEYEESREVHFVRVFIQIVPVGPQRWVDGCSCCMATLVTWLQTETRQWVKPLHDYHWLALGVVSGGRVVAPGVRCL